MPILTVSSPAQSSLVHFSDVDLLLSISQMLIYSSAYVPAADKQQLVKESLTRACYDKREMSNTLSACTRLRSMLCRGLGEHHHGAVGYPKTCMYPMTATMPSL